MIYAKEPEALARGIIWDDAYDEISKKVGLEGGLGHKYYEIGRSLPAGDPQFKVVSEQSREYYDTVRRLFGGN